MMTPVKRSDVFDYIPRGELVLQLECALAVVDAYRDYDGVPPPEVRNQADRLPNYTMLNPKRDGNWYPANGGTEQPTTYRTGRRLLYVWQPLSGDHAYLDLDTDLILSDAEASLARGM